MLVFDVNETLVDIEHLTPLFARVFGDGRIMREWFAQLVLYSQSLTLAGRYMPFGAIGVGVLQMLGRIHGVAIQPSDGEELIERVFGMPAHPDVAPALARLRASGFRLATLTNSPPREDGGVLRKAGLEPFFERCFSVDAVRRFKPAPETYHHVVEALGVGPGDFCLVAAHVWDTLGAQAFGGAGALILRSGNAELPLDGLPPPTYVARDLDELADHLIAAT